MIGHQFCVASSFAPHFKAMDEFKLELKSGNAQYRSKLASFWPVWPWNLTDGLEQGNSEGFDSCDWPNNLTQIGFKSSINQPVWPWNLMNDLEKQDGISYILHRALGIIPNPSVNSNRSYSPEMLHSGQNWWFFCPPQLWTRQIWGNWKLRPAYSPETPNLGQNLWCFVPCDLEIWWMTLENNRASLICCFELCANYIAIGEFKLELQSRNAQFGSNSTIFRAVWPWNLTDDLEKQ